MNPTSFISFFPVFFDFIVQQQQQTQALSWANQLADRIDRVGFLQEQTILSVSTIALATAIPAADSVYVNAAGKPFGPIV